MPSERVHGSIEGSSEETETSLNMSGGVFVGRQREMEQLKTALKEALAGRGRMLMLAGHPGIGKTRTAQELAAAAEEHGARTFWGWCYEGEGAPPYWPWVQIIRSYVNQTDPEQLLTEMGSGASPISGIVPEVRAVVPDLEPVPSLEPEQARFLLFDSVSNFLKSVSDSRPLLLVIDDLHWADRSSLLLLEFLARQLGESQILLVGTYRDMELSRKHPLSETLAQLTRESTFQQVLLRGLSYEDTGRFIETIADVRPSPSVTETIFTHAEGNPFFMREVARFLADSGNLRADEIGGPQDVRVPAGVREVIGQRLNRLSDQCNRMLTVASVIGREFSLDLIQSLMEQDSIVELLEQAVEAHVLDEVQGEVGRYEFAHALFRQTLAEELTITRRVHLHAQIAEALEALYSKEADAHASELVEHFAEAQMVLGSERLVHYSLRAGEQALSGYAFDEALTHFERGLAGRESEYEDCQRADLLFGVGRAQAATLIGSDLQEAVNTLASAFDIYTDLGDSDRAVAVAEYMVPTAPQLRGVARIIERALALVPNDSHTAGKLLSRYSIWLMIEHGDFDTAARMVNRALSIANRESDRQLETWGRVNLATVQLWQSRPKQAFENARLAAELAEESGDLYALAQALQFQGYSSVRQGQFELALKIAADNMAVAERLGSLHRLVMAISQGARTAAILGDWDRARTLVDRGLALAPTEYDLIMTRVLVDQQCGDTNRAEIFLENLISNEGTLGNQFGAVGIAFAAYYSGSQDLLNLAEVAASRRLDSVTNPMIRTNIRIALALIAALRNDKEAATELYAAMTSGRQLPQGLSLSGEHVMALLARTAGETGSVQAHFERALKYGRRTGSHPALAWACVDYAETLLSQTSAIDRRKIGELMEEGMAIVRDLGMQPLLNRFTDLGDRLAAHRGRAAYPYGLTEREVEVLRLVAAGDSNRQIADRLVISVNTVARHINHIYDKTRATNRVEVSALALQHDLA